MHWTTTLISGLSDGGQAQRSGSFELGSSHKSQHKVFHEGTLERQQSRWMGGIMPLKPSVYKCGGREVGMAAC